MKVQTILFLVFVISCCCKEDKVEMTVDEGSGFMKTSNDKETVFHFVICYYGIGRNVSV